MRLRTWRGHWQFAGLDSVPEYTYSLALEYTWESFQAGLWDNWDGWCAESVLPLEALP